MNVRFIATSFSSIAVFILEFSIPVGHAALSYTPTIGAHYFKSAGIQSKQFALSISAQAEILRDYELGEPRRAKAARVFYPSKYMLTSYHLSHL
jgi:hypothetical protein